MESFFLSPLFSKLDDKLFTFLLGKVEKRIERKEVTKAILQFYQYWVDSRYNVLNEDELDMGGIEDFIDEGLVDKLYECCAEIDQPRRAEKYSRIVEEALSRTKANTTHSKESVELFIRAIRDIIIGLTKERVSVDVKMLIGAAMDSADSVASKIEKIKIGPPIHINSEKLAESVKRQKRIIANQPLISSAPERLSFGSLFQKRINGDSEFMLYAAQRIHLQTNLVEYESVTDLYAECKDKSLIIVGNAGVGKTTGLKALFFQDTTNMHILYATIKELHDRTKYRSEMLNYMRMIYDGNVSANNLLLILDGLDEAYSNQSDAIQFMKQILKCGVPVWIGCRTDFFYKIMGGIEPHFDGIAEIKPWDDDTAKSFIKNYSEAVNDNKLVDKMNSIRGESSITSFIWITPFFLTLFLFSVDNEGLSFLPRNEYELIGQFFDNWYEAEKRRGTAKVSKEKYYEQLYTIANILYHRTAEAVITTEGYDESILQFLSKRRTTIEGFTHWNFCVYLISKQIIEATIDGELSIISSYPKAYLNDVTDMTWSQLEIISVRTPRLIDKMNDNLFAVYRQIHERDGKYLSQEARKTLNNMDELTLLMLKDEIIYFSLRLPCVDKLRFFNYASAQDDSTDSIIELGLAYGIGMSMSHPFALQFARKLKPKEPAAILNQSWTVAFFGDQKAKNIYTFTEDTTASWRFARNVRFRRFGLNTEKAYRYRLFDIPLMYCFFSSRNWECDFSNEEYAILEKCDINWIGYTPEEKEFLQEQKKQLIERYKKALKYQQLHLSGQ